MTVSPIYFQFADQHSADLALDTLKELEYEAFPVRDGDRPTIEVVVGRQDLTSALEILQAHGGELLENEAGVREADVLQSAYDLDQALIPAHLVADDWSDDYTEGKSAGSLTTSRPTPAFDPSGDEYDHFDAGIRM